MTDKPTYEEMEQRIQELEQAESEHKRSGESLRESEERYKGLFMNIGSGVAIYEVKGDAEDFIFTDFNKAAEKIDNQKKEAIIGKRIATVFPGVEEFGLLDVFKRVWQTGKAEKHPISFYKDDSLTGWRENFVYKLPSGEIITIYEDITERKQAEAALLRERNNLRNVFDSMEDGIYIVNNQYDIQYVNPVLVKEFGPYEGVKCYRYFHDRDKVCPWCKNQDVLAGKTVRWEWYSSKNERTYDLIDTPMTLSDGSMGKLEIFRDISDRKQTEEALRESEERYRSMMEAMTEPTYICTSDFRVSYMNPAMIKRTGYDATGELCYKALYALDKQCPWCVHEKILQGESVETEIDSPKDGRSFQISNAPIFHQDGSISKITIYRDITDRKLAQGELIESEMELKNKAKDLEELNAALKVLLNKRQEDKEELQEGILSNVRTLIEPYIVKLKKSKPPQSQKTLLNILEYNLNEIVSPLTRRLSSKYLNLTPTQIQVANLVKQGKTNKEISEILHVAGRTIAFHRENIKKKLGLTNKKTNLKTYLMSLD